MKPHLDILFTNICKWFLSINTKNASQQCQTILFESTKNTLTGKYFLKYLWHILTSMLNIFYAFYNVIRTSLSREVRIIMIMQIFNPHRRWWLMTLNHKYIFGKILCYVINMHRNSINIELILTITNKCLIYFNFTAKTICLHCMLSRS